MSLDLWLVLSLCSDQGNSFAQFHCFGQENPCELDLSDFYDMCHLQWSLRRSEVPLPLEWYPLTHDLVPTLCPLVLKVVAFEHHGDYRNSVSVLS